MVLIKKIYNIYEIFIANNNKLSVKILEIDRKLSDKHKEIEKTEESCISLDNWICEL